MTKRDLLKKYPEVCEEIYCDAKSLYSPTWPDYLKEQTKEDWTILEFRSINVGTLFVLRPDGRYKDLASFTLEEMIASTKNNTVTIHKVQKPNGEILTVEDRTNKGKIVRFVVDGNNMIAECESKFAECDVSINNVTKLQPLFVTHDGVDMYKGDQSIPVRKIDFMIYAPSYLKGDCPDSFLYFSTREAAEQFVKENKPTVSIAKLRELGVSNDIINKL